MENSRTSWPWKLAATGAALSVVFALLTIVGGWFVHGDSLASYLWMWATMLMTWPAQHLFGVSGWGDRAFRIFVVLVTNAVILALCGAAIGFMLRSARR